VSGTLVDSTVVDHFFLLTAYGRYSKLRNCPWGLVL
jgi:hypothetical protein